MNAIYVLLTEASTSPAIRSAIPLKMADQELLLAFRRRLRRKAILTVIAAHAQLPEAPDVNRLYELQERNVLAWVVWRTADGPWLYDEEIGALVTTTLDVALGFIEAAREGEKCSHTSTSVPGQPARRVTWLGIFMRRHQTSIDSSLCCFCVTALVEQP